MERKGEVLKKIKIENKYIYIWKEERKDWKKKGKGMKEDIFFVRFEI